MYYVNGIARGWTTPKIGVLGVYHSWTTPLETWIILAKNAGCLLFILFGWPIVSSCGSVTYGVAKELAKILQPLVGKSPHHINSTQDFVEQVKHIALVPGECLSSYDVSAP